MTRANAEAASAFFKDEYELNGEIATYPKPIVVIMDGITMGGGAGQALHASIRVATEHTRVAMPEAAIGFFPDVGSSFFMSRRIAAAIPDSRLASALARYLLVTGRAVRGVDCLRMGLATHYIPSVRMPDLLMTLRASANESFIDIDNTVDAFSEDEPPPSVDLHKAALSTIGQCFGPEADFNSMLQKLTQAGSNAAAETLAPSESPQFSPSTWAKECHSHLQRLCPTSLAVADALALRASRTTLHGALATDYVLSQAFLSREIGDLHEGVTSKLVKKIAPQWSPASSAAAVHAVMARAATQSRLVFAQPDIAEYPHPDAGLPSVKTIIALKARACPSEADPVAAAASIARSQGWIDRPFVLERIADVLSHHKSLKL